jgi:hypothetical protein
LRSYRSSRADLSTAAHRDEKKLFFLRHFVGASLPLANLRTTNAQPERKSDPLRGRYIKTVITGMRSFIALRRQKRRGPRANGKLGVALGILELADKRAVRSSRTPPFSSTTSSSVAPPTAPSFSLPSVPRMLHASMDDLRRFFAFLLILHVSPPLPSPIPRAAPMYSKLNCRYLSNVEINKPLTLL